MAKTQPLERQSLHRWGLSKSQKSTPALVPMAPLDKESPANANCPVSMMLQTDLPCLPGQKEKEEEEEEEE